MSIVITTPFRSAGGGLDLGPAPLIWYKLDDTANTSGSTIIDSSGNGYNATLEGDVDGAGATALINDGGKSMDFEAGGNGNTATPFDSAFNNIVCVEFWHLMPTMLLLGEGKYPIMQFCDAWPNTGASSPDPLDPTKNGFHIAVFTSELGPPYTYYGYTYYYYDISYEFRAFDGSGLVGVGTADYGSGLAPYPPEYSDAIFHVVVNFGYTASDTLDMYINGTLVGSGAISAPWTLGGNILRIGEGYRAQGSSVVTDIAIDDVRMYTQHLTPTQILNRYNTYKLP